MAWTVRHERKLRAALRACAIAEGAARHSQAGLNEARKALNTKTAEAVMLRLHLEQQRRGITP